MFINSILFLQVQNACYSQGIEEYGSMVTEYIVNPKAVSIAELYGDYNNAREVSMVRLFCCRIGD